MRPDDEDVELEPLEEEVDEDEDEDSIDDDACRLCGAETEIGSDLCEDCGKCAACEEPWDYKTAKVAKKTEDGRVCESCFEENGYEVEESDEEDDEEEEDDDEDY